MTVDMHEWRFRQELARVEPFVDTGARDALVWKQGFPAWRAIFTEMLLWGHSTGYRLFSFEEFFRRCKVAYTEKGTRRDDFKPYFEPPLLDGTRHRFGVWYESGMAETHLYACLVEAIEDKTRKGVVLYDPRADWKLKADTIVILSGKSAIVSSYFGDEELRPVVEMKRDAVEQVRKINTAESSHWKNEELKRMAKFEIARTPTNSWTVNGVRLFSLPSVNQLLARLYENADVSEGFTFPIEIHPRK